MNEVLIIEYDPSYASELLRLLLELQSTYFKKSASAPIQELREDKDITKSYGDYVNMLNANIGNGWKALLAINSTHKAIGFIIGSLDKDDGLVHGNIGKLEDWFVEEEYRGQGVGAKLYNELEQWFVENGCNQIVSETWLGNVLSIKAHKEFGFFESGIIFSKKLK